MAENNGQMANEWQTSGEHHAKPPGHQQRVKVIRQTEIIKTKTNSEKKNNTKKRMEEEEEKQCYIRGTHANRNMYKNKKITNKQ